MSAAEGEDEEGRYATAVQLIDSGRGEEAIAELGRQMEASVGEHRTRAAIQLARIGPAALAAYRSLVRAAMNHEDDGLALTAIETLNAIDPENLVGAPQVVRLLRRRVLRMWRGGAFLRVSMDESIFVRLVKALAINGRYFDGARFELEHQSRSTSGRMLAAVTEALAGYGPREKEENEAA